MDLENSAKRFDTIAIRGGYDQMEALNHSGSICEPAYLTPAQHYDTSKDMRDSLQGEAYGWTYTRIDNPTIAHLEAVIAQLEGYGCECNVTSTVFSSGMAAIFMAANALTANDGKCTSPNIVLPVASYGGSYMLFTERFERDRGIRIKWIYNTLDLSEWEKAINEDTRFVMCEVPSNPLLRMTDIRAVAEVAHAYNKPLIVDATVASPALIRPLGLGADIVVHSASKSMSTNGLSIAGVVSSRKNIVCNHGRLEMKEDFSGFLKRGPQRDIGAVLSPFNALMTISDLRSLRTHTQTISKSAMRLATYLSDSPFVKEVFYPGLQSDPGHAIAKRDMILVDSELETGVPINHYGYLLSFRPNNGSTAARAFLDQLRLFWRANDLGRIKSTATIPSISTHSQLSDKEKELADVPDDLIRMSVGCEHFDDILGDVHLALESIKDR